MCDVLAVKMASVADTVLNHHSLTLFDELFVIFRKNIEHGS